MPIIDPPPTYPKQMAPLSRSNRLLGFGPKRRKDSLNATSHVLCVVTPHWKIHNQPPVAVRVRKIRTGRDGCQLSRSLYFAGAEVHRNSEGIADDFKAGCSGNLRVPIPVTHCIGSNLYATLIEVLCKRQDLRLERVDGS